MCGTAWVHSASSNQHPPQDKSGIQGWDPAQRKHACASWQGRPRNQYKHALPNLEPHELVRPATRSRADESLHQPHSSGPPCELHTAQALCPWRDGRCPAEMGTAPDQVAVVQKLESTKSLLNKQYARPPDMFDRTSHKSRVVSRDVPRFAIARPHRSSAPACTHESAPGLAFRRPGIAVSMRPASCAKRRAIHQRTRCLKHHG